MIPLPVVLHCGGMRGLGSSKFSIRFGRMVQDIRGRFLHDELSACHWSDSAAQEAGYVTLSSRTFPSPCMQSLMDMAAVHFCPSKLSCCGYKAAELLTDDSKGSQEFNPAPHELCLVLAFLTPFGYAALQRHARWAMGSLQQRVLHPMGISEDEGKSCCSISARCKVQGERQGAPSFVLHKSGDRWPRLGRMPWDASFGPQSCLSASARS